MEGTALALYFFTSVVCCSISNVFRDLLYFYCIFARFLSTVFRYATRDDSCIDDGGEEELTLLRERDQLSTEDVEVVVRRLGMGEWRVGERWREELNELLEEKEAGLAELKEAFYVFDRNEDGFITPAELWSVMRRLGMREGGRMVDCVRMVSAFDEDGDGRISFLEFKRLLENAM